eukprot:scaffold22357_cov51-Prasinocladus_malaysianus.AAC.1
MSLSDVGHLIWTMVGCDTNHLLGGLAATVARNFTGRGKLAHDMELIGGILQIDGCNVGYRIP